MNTTERQRARRAERRELGLCIDCGKPADGKARCVDHSIKDQFHKANHRRQLQALRPPKPDPVVVERDCDCGTPIGPQDECCARCAYLDGLDVSERVGDVVCALRGSPDGMTALEICEALGLKTYKNNGPVQVFHMTKVLIERGRVRRYWRENEAHDRGVVGSFSRTGAGSGCWVYVLDGLTEREWKRRAA